MGMPALHPVTTIEELLALPEDGLRHELLDGVHVVTPAPALLHQRAVGALYRHLLEALRDRDDAEVFTSPADVVLGPRTLVQPDLFVVRRVPGRVGGPARSAFVFAQERAELAQHLPYRLPGNAAHRGRAPRPPIQAPHLVRQDDA